jgi:hypothetical protein
MTHDGLCNVTVKSVLLAIWQLVGSASHRF